MKIDKFWESWSDISDIEQRAGEATLKALERVFEELSEEKIHAVYIKGSFATREMLPKSDIDIQIVVKDNDDIQKVLEVKRRYRKEYAPADILPLSLWEFRHSKRYMQDGKIKSKPDNFLRWLDRHKLIYGEPLDPSAYPMRSDKEALRGHIGAFRDTFIPLYENERKFFDDTAKQVFWLASLEKKIEGETFADWKHLVESYPEGHIVRRVHDHRYHRVFDGKEQEAIDSVKTYIEELERKYMG